MYPNSALSAGQLAIMAVVVVVSLAVWLILVALAARQPRGTSAAVNTGPREEETAATVTWLPSDDRPADKTAALSGTVPAGAPAPAWRPRERIRHYPVHGKETGKFRMHDHPEV